MSPNTPNWTLRGMRTMSRIAALSSNAAVFAAALAGLQFAAVSTPANAAGQTAGGTASKKVKPLFRDFMGLNVHSVVFKPDVYKPVCRLLRDYHPVVWDL